MKELRDLKDLMMDDVQPMEHGEGCHEQGGGCHEHGGRGGTVGGRRWTVERET